MQCSEFPGAHWKAETGSQLACAVVWGVAPAVQEGIQKCDYGRRVRPATTPCVGWRGCIELGKIENVKKRHDDVS